MKTMFSWGYFARATAAVSAWVLRREIRHFPLVTRVPKAAAVLRQEELRQRPWEGRN